MHGGASPQATAARERRLVQLRAEAEAALLNPGGPVPSPSEALLQELERTHRTIGGLQRQLQVAEEAGLSLQDRAGLTDRLMGERGHIARLATDMVRLDIVGRQMSLTEKYADSIEALVVGLIQALGFDPANEQVRAVAHRVLMDVAERDQYRMSGVQAILGELA